MSWKKAILHLDGDAFFAACEIALNPALKGRPVVTGLEKGTATAFSYEAKARGITRGMRLFEIRQTCPDAVILPGDYHTYRLFSERMVAIVRRHVSLVEEYSIDECFADLTPLISKLPEGERGPTLRTVAGRIKADLKRDLGLTFSVGVAPTKVLAKAASKRNKPDGLTILPTEGIRDYLADLPVGKVWGLGPSTAVKLNKKRVFTALEFVDKPEAWVAEYLAKPHVEIWRELRGDASMPVRDGSRSRHQSLRATRMLKKASTERAVVFSDLSRNAEAACHRLRRLGLKARELSFFLKTSEFRYLSESIELPYAVNHAHEVVSFIRPRFEKLFVPGVKYRATGVVCSGIIDAAHIGYDLFGREKAREEDGRIYSAIDRVHRKFGTESLMLASSLVSARTRSTGPFAVKRFSLPYMGEVE